MLSGRRGVNGFTLIEVVVAMLVLSVAILGLGASASRLTTVATATEVRTLAIEAANDRIARIHVDPRYGALDSLYTATETDVPGLAGFTRTTSVSRIVATGSQPADYTRVSVAVNGPGLEQPIRRSIIVGAP